MTVVVDSPGRAGGTFRLRFWVDDVTPPQLGRLRVADRGLREGLLVELMAEDGVWRPRSGRRGGDRAHG